MHKTSMGRASLGFAVLAFACAGAGATPLAWGQGAEAFRTLDAAFLPQIQPLLKTHCFECHAGDRTEADIDLASFKSLADVRKHPKIWQKVGEMIDSGQMPPKDSKPLADADRKRLEQWVREYLKTEAQARAGDPGRVVLRRLSNAEYTYTVRDLTGVDSLDPAREFPVDSAAGEGFSNAGAALVMSPALVTKYLDAGKDISRHLVLVPGGFRFSPDVTRGDWTNDVLARIRKFYRDYADPSGSDQVNLQGIVFNTNEGGRLPVERYLAATLDERDALRAGSKTIEQVARERKLSPKYLGLLWKTLNVEPKSGDAKNEPSLLLDGVRRAWKSAKPADAKNLAVDIARWQQTLWRFTSVGHIGKVNGPKAWMEPVTPISPRQEFRLKLTPPADGQDLVLYLTAGDAGDGAEGDFAIWERPRLVSAGRPDLLLRDVRGVTRDLAARRQRLLASTAKSLAAAHDAGAAQGTIDTAALAKKHDVDPESLAAWLGYLGIGAGGPVKLGTPLPRKMESGAGYDFIKGWVGDDALSLVANSSDQQVRIPGTMKPHSVAVHPSPTLSVAVGWKSPVAASLHVEGLVQHAHHDCGDGVSWVLELRRGNTRRRLAAGVTQGPKFAPLGPLEKVGVQVGDVLCLVVSPRTSHSCDLTAIDLTLKDGTREWNLAKDVSSNLLAGNPHKDGFDNPDVWHFYSEPASGAATGPVIPAGSMLARWQSAESPAEKQKLADQLQQLLQAGPAGLPKDSPDVALHQQLTSLGGPLLAAAFQSLAGQAATGAEGAGESPFGLDAKLFGKHPSGAALDPASLCVRAPSVLEVRLPAGLVQGAELVVAGTLHPETAKEGTVQLQILNEKPDAAATLKPAGVTETNAAGPWTSNNRGVAYSAPILALDGSAARQRVERGFEEFRQLFPSALCYTKIVPVDEVVTLTLFYREDDQLRRLMLDERQTAQLDRLWDELHYISQDALTLVDAYAQLMEYATQDADPKVFEPLRKPIHDRAAKFRQAMLDTQPKHVDALVAFASQAYRRPATEAEAAQVRGLYQKLREQELPHEEAVRLTLARILVAPAFLYRMEKPAAGAQQGPVNAWELASRLSYFLWSSQPDEELRSLAASGRLTDPDVLASQAKRMLQDPKTRRLAVQFACQWLHIHDFDHLDEKSERHFPTFAGLRGAMYEESIQFFTDLFQHDRSILNILDADYTYLNEDLAKHYGIPGVTGAEWRRVEGVRKYSRGGILTQATTLSKQSGASRTSPILRGNWLSEVVLGEKLPRPPKNVPQLSDTVPAGLTERQLIEKHSSDAACAKCHARIDPFGFSLENFDAIGRFREKDAAGLAIDSRTQLADGTKLDGLAGLRDYLLNARRDAFLRQFERKLLGFALGRAVQLSDEPLLAEMQAALGRSEYHVGTAVEMIVRSPQFRDIRGRDHADED